MFRFTNGPADEMQLWIALGIVTYLVVAPCLVLAAVVCGEFLRRAAAAVPAAAGTPGTAPTAAPAHPRAGAPARTEVGVGTAA